MSDFWQQDQRVNEQINIGRQLNFIADIEDRVYCPACDSSRAEQMKVAWENNSRAGPGGTQLALNLWGQRVCPPQRPRTPAEVERWSGMPRPVPPTQVPRPKRFPPWLITTTAVTTGIALCIGMAMCGGFLEILGYEPDKTDAKSDRTAASPWSIILFGIAVLVCCFTAIGIGFALNQSSYDRARKVWVVTRQLPPPLTVAEWTTLAEEAWRAELQDWKTRWKCRECDAEFHVTRK